MYTGIAEKMYFVEKYNLFFSLMGSTITSCFIRETCNHWLAASLDKRLILFLSSSCELSCNSGIKRHKGQTT